MIPDKVIKRVPGAVSNTKEKYLDNLDKLSVPALNEALDRQKKLLEDRAFVQKLPDRGERIIKLKERLENELKKRNELSDICEVMSGLTVNGKELSERLEWSVDTKLLPASQPADQNLCDSDETINPLKIIASHSGTSFNKKLIRKEKPDESLIKQSDLQDLESTVKNIDDVQKEPFAVALCSKLDGKQPKEKFLPYKTLTHTKEVDSSKVRDVSAATPLVSKLANVKQVSLEESIKLQAYQAKHLREVQLKHAAEKLKEKGSIMGDLLPPLETTAYYRETMPSDSEEEILDEDAKEERGGVTFPLANS